jgi:NitT/TauT family transport system substrate-binding protein
MRPDPAGSQPLAARQHRRPGWCLLAAASLAGVVALAGCAGGGTSGTPVSGTITIAAAPGVDDAPLWVAAQKGFFTDAGLHVKIIQYGSDAQELQAVEHGQAQIAAADYGNVFYQQTLPHVDLRILADAYDAGSGTAEILVGPRFAGSITSPVDLKNVAIGLPSDGAIPFSEAAGTTSQPQPNSVSLLAAAATRLASAYLIGAADKLQWQLMSQQQEVAELGSGALHAALLTEPYIYQAESVFGATSIMDVFSGATATLPVTGYAATASWVRSNPAAVSDFQTAIERAQTQAAMVGTVQRELTSLPGSGFSTIAAKMVSIGTYPAATSTAVLQRALQRVEQLLSVEGILAKNAASIPAMLGNG